MDYAVKNLTRCVKETDLEMYAISVLMHLAIDMGKEGVQVKNLETPQKYLDGLRTCLKRSKSDHTVELLLAEAYLDLNTPG